MRFIVAIVTFVIAFLMIAYGIAQRTVLSGPSDVTVSTTATTDASVTVIGGAVLNAKPGSQKVEISGADTIFAAYGRTEDVLAWIGDTAYNKVSFNAARQSLTSKLVPGAATKVPNPHGSDLWLGEYTRAKNLTVTVNVPKGISMLIVSDGVAPAPGRLSVTWPLDNRTPWSGPLIAGGGLLLLIGVALYLWGLVALRRSRGPRRKPPKTPKMPKLPRPPSYKSRGPKAIVAARGRRAIRRMVAIVPVVLIGSLAMSGCSSDLWPDFATRSSTPTSSPTASATVGGVETAPPPVVTVSQVENIVARASAVAEKSDAALDGTLLATRFTGPALALRVANYAIRKVDSTVAAPAPIPASPIALTLPQQSDTWPRTVFTVIQDPSKPDQKPIALMLTQQTPRDNYMVQYAVKLESKAVLPKVAPANVGAARVQPNVKLFAIAPDALAPAFGDIVANGQDSKYLDKFDLTDDPLLKQIGLDSRNAAKAKLPASAAMEFTNVQVPGDNIALATSDSGALVTVYMQENVEVKPTQAGASVNAEGLVKSLSGVTSTTKGTLATYGDQLLFFVPSATSKGKIVLLGWDTGLVAAKELG